MTEGGITYKKYVQQSMSDGLKAIPLLNKILNAKSFF